MNKDLIDTIMEKEFHALTEVEREELKSYCASEDEYNQMKEVFLGMEQMVWEHPKPKTETKQRLDSLFDATYPKAAPVWYSSALTVILPKEKPMYRQPLVQIAAIALLALLLVPFWNSDADGVKSSPEQQIAQASSTEKTMEVTKDSYKTVTDTNEPSEVLEDLDNNNPNQSPVLVASAQPMSGAASMAGSDVMNSDHPDGVFVAVSQPASEAPELLDLLTATF